MFNDKREIIDYCLTYAGAYEDYPFHDPNWCVMRHSGNTKSFALIYIKNGQVWINIKCDPDERDFWRNVYNSVIPAYHMNKEHWNTIIIDGTVPDEIICEMISKSYALTK